MPERSGGQGGRGSAGLVGRAPLGPCRGQRPFGRHSGRECSPAVAGRRAGHRLRLGWHGSSVSGRWSRCSWQAPRSRSTLFVSAGCALRASTQGRRFPPQPPRDGFTANPRGRGPQNARATIGRPGARASNRLASAARCADGEGLQFFACEVLRSAGHPSGLALPGAPHWHPPEPVGPRWSSGEPEKPRRAKYMQDGCAP